MTTTELIRKAKDSSFSDLIPIKSVQTEADKEALQKRKYAAWLTEEEFQKAIPGIPVENVYYGPFLATDTLYFNKESLAVCLLHPELLQIGSSSFWTPDAMRKAVESAEQAAATGNYSRCTYALCDSMRLEHFTMLLERKADRITDLYDLFTGIYKTSDFGFNHLSLQLMQKVISTRPQAQTERFHAFLADLPETVTVYRGGNSASTPAENAYSWTLDINVAYFFACRLGNGSGTITMGHVAKADILDAFTDGDTEREIIVDPATVRISSTLELYGGNWLKDKLYDAAFLYRSYRDFLVDKVTFSHESEAHGKEHSARVLLLCLLIGNELRLPFPDLKVLALASVFHDTRREHDNDDESHGRKAVAYCRSFVKEDSEFVELLCEYHCLPDEAGFAAISRERRFKKRRERATTLLKVFKDADGLERVRFGLRELDVNQLRMDVSKKLVLVANLAVRGIKL